MVKEVIAQAVKQGFVISEIVSGRAPGADTLGERWALENGIPVKSFPPQYKLYGAKNAPKIRNTQMASYADALIAVTFGDTPGTADMIEKAKAQKLRIFVRNVHTGESLIF
jgi:hypothetical protein